MQWKLIRHTSWWLWKIAVITVITSSCRCFGREALLITEKMFAVCLPTRTGWNNIFPCHCKEAPQTGCCLERVDSNPGWTALVICLISSLATAYMLSMSSGNEFGLFEVLELVWWRRCHWSVRTLEWLPRCIKSNFCFCLGASVPLAAVNKTRWNKICALFAPKHLF